MGKIEQERCIGTDYDTDSCLIIIGKDLIFIMA